jgi:hypothetical protein
VIEHGDPKAILAEFGLDADGIARTARALLDRAHPISGVRPRRNGLTNPNERVQGVTLTRI